MDGLTFAILVAACAPLVHPATAHALVAVESAFNPNAIGVIGGALQRQPRTPEEAMATALALKAHGKNFSAGLAQINVANLERLGLTVADSFEPCRNLGAMQAVLGECLARAGGSSEQPALRRALSCYYSGNFTTGFRHGYVGRVVAASRVVSAGARAPP
jgi:type IV secretion system protein VirB1